jgi:phosphocarrier protein HPr
MEVVEKKLKIINRLGLHARAAGQFRKIAGGYKCEIEVKKGTMTANAKSLLGLMALEASQGTSIFLKASGDDANEAVNALDELVSDRFGENE